MTGQDETKKEYWNKLLTGLEQGCLPERDCWEEDEGYRTVSAPFTAPLREKTDPQAYFTAAAAYLLSIFCGRDDVNLTVAGESGRFPLRLQTDCGLVSELVEKTALQLTESRLSAVPYEELTDAFSLDPMLHMDCRITGEETAQEVHDAPIVLEICGTTGAYSLSLKAACAYYSEAWAGCFLRSYIQLLTEFSAKDDLAELTLVHPDDLSLLDSFNETDIPRDKSNVVAQFRRAAAEYPDHTAVVAGTFSCTYREADRLTDALAGHLKSLGIGRGSVVSVLIHRNEYMALATFGILKTGAAYQPLDPGYPEARLKFMMEDAEASLLIADRTLIDKVPDRKCPVLYTDEIPGLPDCPPFDAGIEPDDVYILLYTSGTTGTPKGVMLMHRNISAFVGWAHAFYHIDSTSCAAAYASYGFDAHMIDLYPAFTAGAALHIIQEEMRLDLAGIARYFEDNGVTHVLMTTQVGRQFAQIYEGKSLKALSVGGETLVPLDPSGMPFRFINAYGPTECTILITAQDVDKLYHRVPIGAAVENTKLYVVDKKLRRLPPYAPGELLAAGHRVGKGYLHLPEKTAESFIPNPFCTEEAYSRTYRTGDIVRMPADGRVDFIGRNDGQVKVRGFRIELAEVEEVIRRCPGIKDATVQAFSDERTGMKYLAAYVVSDEKVDVAALNTFIKERKPAYMVPAVTMQLPKIPLTQNQKVDKRSLPLPARTETDHTKPETEAQQQVYDCCEDVLGHNDFGIDTDLDEAGLSSIGAMRLIVLLSRTFGKTVMMRDVKDKHTVRQLAAFLETAEEEKVYELRDHYPLSGVQQGILVECMSNSGSTIYNIPLLLKLGASVDLDRLTSALEATFNAHPYLKMRLEAGENGEVEAWRHDDEKIEIYTVSQDTLVMGFAGLVLPFKLIGEKLYRLVYITGGDANYLFFDAHHILFDGESLNVFTRDLARAYDGELLDVERFTGFEAALAETELKASPAYEKAHAYYNKLLDGLDTDCLPVRDKNEPMSDVGVLEVEMPVDKTAVAAAMNQYNLSQNAVWNAAFGLMLKRWLARPDCVYTTVYNGRSDSRLADAVGMFVHTLPVVVDTKEGETGTEFASRIGAQLRSSMENDLYPFSEISRNYDVKANILLVYEGSITGDIHIGGEKAETVMLPPDKVKAPLTFFIFDTDEGYRINCEYEAEHFEQWHIDSMIRAMMLCFKGILANEKVQEISLVTEEQRTLLDDFNKTDKAYERTTLTELFRRRAKEDPAAPALFYKDITRSYGEVDELSDRIAAYAQNLGIGCEDVISILIPRGEYMVSATLGALKAGAAYQPLDPSYPTERLSFMIEDAGAKLLIADDDLLYLLPDYTGPVLKISEIASLPQAVPKETPQTADSLLILLYTSGTTGKPKGVMLTHGNLVNFCDWYRDHYGLKKGDVVGAYASYGFDACMMDLYTPLTTGAAVCIVPEDIRIDLPLLNEYYKSHGVTHVFMTTQMGRMFADSIQDTTLRHLSVGGEKLVPIAPPADYTLTNIYGPTECTVCATTYAVDKLYDRIPIGQALSNYRLYIADSNGNELPIGAMGELYISGHGVGRGYLNLPERTAQSFVTNPFCTEPGFERAFRTGDIVRRLPNGCIDFIGRNDGQVKIRGFRIELAEVEGVIREYPGIKDVTVQAFDDEKAGGKFIAAYVVSDEEVDPAVLGSFIKSKKPPYMVPASIMQLDAIPLNQNQKANKRALPQPVRGAEQRSYEAPATPLEKELCDEYGAILGLEQVSAADSFFDIGGTSISAARVVMFAMNKGYSIVYKDVFDNPSPRALAKVISGIRGKDNSDAAADYDYSKINELLAFNSMEHVDEISVTPIEDIILCGATGFLGMHVLKAFLDKNSGKVYCLIRRGPFNTLEERMKAMLMYYFGDSMEELFGSRIFCINGDITDPEELKALDDIDASVIINCAACVKHFANDDILDKVNYYGVQNLIEVCLRTGKRLVQTSTLSVGGEMNIDNMRTLYENTLYIGQSVDNDYVRTKFLAERAVLQAKADKGLSACIVRLGNLMSRYTDGEFQINFITNSFMRSLWAFNTVGECPVTALEQPAEFSPIDSTAEAVLILSGADNRFSVFHVHNDHVVSKADVIYAMREYGFNIDIVSEQHFSETLAETAKKEADNEAIIGLVAYANKEGEKIVETFTNNRFTVNALYRLGFKWPIISDDYIKKALWALDSLEFFG